MAHHHQLSAEAGRKIHFARYSFYLTLERMVGDFHESGTFTECSPGAVPWPVLKPAHQHRMGGFLSPFTHSFLMLSPITCQENHLYSRVFCFKVFMEHSLKTQIKHFSRILSVGLPFICSLRKRMLVHCQALCRPKEYRDRPTCPLLPSTCHQFICGGDRNTNEPFFPLGGASVLKHAQETVTHKKDM